MMKIWFTFFILFSCGCLIHSQDVSISIVTIGNAEVIEYSENVNKATAESYVSDSKKTNITKCIKLKLKNHTKINLKYSRKEIPGKSETPRLVYKNSSSDTFFLNSFGQELSAVLSFNSHIDLKESFNYRIRYILYYPNFIVKQNTYYYLFSKDTGKLYQFFNKPPPISFFS